MEVVETPADIEANLRRLEAYLSSSHPEDREFAQALVRAARCLVVARRGDALIFGPSRFVGYRDNSRAEHEANEDKDGRETNDAVSRALQRDWVTDPRLEERYHEFCARIAVS